MLVLSRKTNERICIGEEIEITVVEIRGGRVRIGINCPRNISIVRTELLHREDFDFELTCTNREQVDRRVAVAGAV